MIPEGCTQIRCEHPPAQCVECRRSYRECALDERAECWRCSLPRWEAYLADDKRNVASPRAARWGTVELMVDETPVRRGKR